MPQLFSRFLSGTATLAIVLTVNGPLFAQQTVARQWNENLLHSISNDTARPTVHARNLFHVSAAMYDAWAAYDSTAQQYFHTEKVDTSGMDAGDIEFARREAISHAAFNVITYRFFVGPGAAVGESAAESLISARNLMDSIGYDYEFTSREGDSPAAVGNRIARTITDFGLSDGANESNKYTNPPGWEPVNDPLTFTDPGTEMNDPNRWQPLHFVGDRFDQFGQPIDESTQVSLSPYWGDVTPFAIRPEHRSEDGVYHDQGPPPLLGGAQDAEFMDNALTVIRYSSRLDPSDGVMIDISPVTRGNSPFPSYEQVGYEINPITNEPYEPHEVNQADFGRIMAEFWADGPNSTAPPGHWNEIANYTSDRMEELGIEKRIGGVGPAVDDLEYDIKKYFALNGAVHDAAVAAWNHKGIYDYVRPISAIRYMGQNGQSTDPNHTIDLGEGNVASTYHPYGLPLETGLVEVVTPETTSAGGKHEHLAGSEGKIAINTWIGPIEGEAPFDDPNDFSGVDWILAENWLPYQLSSFVTPPFPGYVSGHSTFSRAGAEILTALTGTPFFPGGLGEFVIEQGSGLDFEYGPTEEVRLQWATYFDASDQASLSRIYGGIHPPADDLPGRMIGHLVGLDAWDLALDYFGSNFTLVGDYNGNGQVEQADLDLVLLNWGEDAGSVPLDWTNDLPEGTIDQNELDAVLLNWSTSSAAAASSVPEPAGLVIVTVLMFTWALAAYRRAV